MTPEGWKRDLSKEMGALECGDLWKGVRQWMSSVFGTEKETPISLPFLEMLVRSLCRRRMFSLCESDATVMEESST